LLATSTAAVSIGLIGYAASPGFWFLMVVAALIGFGSGAVDAGLNFYAAEHFSVTVMNWLHAFFGIGAMIGPFIMAGVLDADASWRIGYTIVAGATFLMAIAFIFTVSGWDDGVHQDHESKSPTATVNHVLRQPLVWIQIALFFFMTGIEAAAGAWSFTMLFEKFDIEPGVAGLWAGFYWGMIALGRLVLPPLLRSLQPARLIQIGTLGLVVGAAMMTRDQVWMFQAGLLVFGLAMAPLFPTLAGILAGRTTLDAIPWTIAVVATIVIALETLLRDRADGGDKESALVATQDS